MEYYDSAVVDIETGGVHAGRSYVLQIAGVKFNSKTKAVSPDFFDRCLLPQPTRAWDEGTREFWLKRPELLRSMMARMEDTRKVLEDFAQWAGYGSLSFWAKPTHFDFAFLQCLYADYGMQIPFGFRQANDQNSFARGVYFPEEPPKWEKIIPFQGEEHNARDDCLHQLRVIYKLLDREPAPQ